MSAVDPDEAVIVEFQATRPDGGVSLELNATIADLEVKKMRLVSGQTLRVWEPWGDDEHVADGTVGGTTLGVGARGRPQGPLRFRPSRET